VTVLAAGTGASTAAREALGTLTRTVCVVSARHHSSVHAMTVDSLAAVAADPARVVLAVRPDSRWWRLASASGVFAVSVLSGGQEDLARWFASRRRGGDSRQFQAIGWRPGPLSRAPVLEGASAWFECRVEAVTHVAGQMIVVARPDDDGGGASSERPALLRIRGAYQSLG